MSRTRPGSQVGLFPRDETGFTIIESVVALVIIFGLLLVIMRTFDTGVRTVVETKRQAAASAFASELMERARSLEWENVGLAGSVFGDDCGTQQIGCYGSGGASEEFTNLVYGVPVADEYAFGGEIVVFANGDTFRPFLDFHEEVTRDNTIFDRYLFVTSVRTDPTDEDTEQYRRLTAVVAWDAPGGFRDRVDLTSLVSRFNTPSQPLISGTVILRGGSVSIEGDVTGTTGFLGLSTAREPISVSWALPSLIVSSTSDYVSGGSVVATSTSAIVTWAGDDYDLDTADDETTNYDPVEETVAVDDDGGSTAALNDSTAFFDLTPEFSVSGARPEDVVITDATAAGLWMDSTDSSTGERETWTEHDPGVTPDYLPYSYADLAGPEMHLFGTVEYSELESQLAYGGLGEESYDFPILIRSYGGTSFEGTVNRENDVTENRSVNGYYSWDGDVAYLLYDEVYDHEPSTGDFQGFVRVTLPSVDNAAADAVAAGEGIAIPAHTMNDNRNLTIEVWDPSDTDYDVVFDSAYSDLEDFSDTVVVATEASPMTVTITHPNSPDIQYSIWGSLDVNGWTYNTSTDALGNADEGTLYADRIVEGTLHYAVRDTTLGQYLFDIEINFDLGGFTVVAAYLDPEA